MTDRELPLRYVAALVSLILIAALWVLTWLGVPPFDNITVFLLTNVVGLLAVIVLGVLGGAFVGLMLAHRIFSTRAFSPFERAVMESLLEIKEHQRAIEERLAAVEATNGARRTTEHPVREK